MSHIVVVRENFCKDFIASLVLDILHDSKSRSSLYGAKLAQITDLLASSFILHNPDKTFDETSVNIYFFKWTLEYFCCELWDNNLSALGLHIPPNFKNNEVKYWQDLRTRVIIPFRNVSDRYNECTFAPLGGSRTSAESYNYALQRSKLTDNNHEFISFISPHGINSPEDFYIQIAGVTDIVQSRMPGARVVLDMKTAAGLIRTITDPIGYINNIATNCDPGRDMPGMKALRQNATSNSEKQFNFIVKLDTPNLQGTLFDVTYSYESLPNGYQHKRANITILDNLFRSKLPRSVDMSEALNQYLAPSSKEFSITIGEMIEKIYSHIKDYHLQVSKNEVNDILKHLHNTGSINRNLFITYLKGTLDAADVYRVVNWVTEGELIPRIVYVLSTIKNMKIYGKSLDFILPTKIIKELVKIFEEFRENKDDYKTLGFCYHQLNILRVYALYPNNGDKWSVLDGIYSAKIRGKRGRSCNLTTQIREGMKQALSIAPLLPFRNYTDVYFENFLRVCERNLSAFINIDDNEKMFNFLCDLPTFDPPKELAIELEKRMMLLSPEIYKNYTGQSELILNEALAVSNYLLYIDFKRPYFIRYTPLSEENRLNAIYQTLGKFSGDFGQILWSLFHSQIFATEDNNASAMALIIHRIHGNMRWATIHGLGDGSAVEITLNN